MAGLAPLLLPLLGTVVYAMYPYQPSKYGFKSMPNVEVPWTMGMKPFKKCVTPGTNVTISWNPEDHHNVEKVTKDVFDSCSGFKYTEVDRTGLYIWTAPSFPCTTYLVCSVGFHCAEGNMKATIKVAKHCRKRKHSKKHKKHRKYEKKRKMKKM